MWITGDVELPDEILDAHERGKLVFFVGAGASRGAPSNLPLFDGLAKALASLAEHPFPEESDTALDRYVGELESLDPRFDAHRHARSLISDPESEFNPCHRAVVDLADHGAAFRVVTTNYDDHLASAARSEGIDVPDTWYAPALPLGRDFTGLVHLHGSVKRPENELVLTDRDFGRAYLTDAWAVRFLLPMFDRFTVVFVGYSHDDVIMRYLALGLPSEERSTTARRFAFTSEASDDKWSYLGIHPISYPVKGRDHGALVEALDAWAERARMGRTDHRSRVRDIVAAGTSLPLPDRDYLRARLRTVDGVHDFASVTGSLSDEAKLMWLTWLEKLPEFKALFSARDVSEATVILGDWFAETIIASETLNGAGLQTLQRLGQSMTTELYQRAVLSAGELADRDAMAGMRWQVVLATSIYGQSAPVVTESSAWHQPNSVAPSVAVLRAALRPFLKLGGYGLASDSSELPGSPYAEVVWRSGYDGLTEQIRRAVNMSDLRESYLGGALEEAVAAAYDLLDAYYGDRGWDPVARHRSAIESHAQDSWRRTSLDAVIDGLRDYGIKALSVRPDLPDRWWSFDRALMRRLALHLVANDPTRSADDKLSWLLEHTGLYARYLKHETYQVLTAVGEASASVKADVLEAVDKGPCYLEGASEKEGHSAYAKYNLLAWLKENAPNWSEVQDTFAVVENQNPDFAPREHPDFDMWMTSGARGSVLPIETEDFLQRLTQDVSVALDGLLAIDYSAHDFDRPDWDDALRLVQNVAERRPDLGVRLWDTVRKRNDLEGRRVSLLCSIAEGWGEGDLGDSGLDVVERLFTLLPEKDSADAIGRFLLEQIQRLIDTDESSLTAEMRKIARALWNTHGAGFSYAEDIQPLSCALYLNSWPGFLAQYWGSEIDRRWRHTREQWDGLNTEESEALVALLHGNDSALDATQPAIAGQLYFYYSADAVFATTYLLPIFGDPRRHAFAWSPYLYHPGWNDAILAAGLYDHMLSELTRLHELPAERERDVFLELIVAVVSYAGIDSSDRRRLLNETVCASDGAYAVEFGDAVNRILRAEGVSGEEVWRRWLRAHVERRLNGIPRIASKEECEQWADVVPTVGKYVPDAVVTFSGRGIGLGGLAYEAQFSEGVLSDYGGELVEFFAERVRNTVDPGVRVRLRVTSLIKTLQSSLGHEAVEPLVSAAVERGFPVPRE